MKKFSVTLIGAVSILLSGCAAIPLEPQANRIIASPNQAPQSCKYVGQIIGNQGNFFSGSYTSNQPLEQGAMNDMKNKASKLGANYIQLITTRAGFTGSLGGSGGSISGGASQTNVTNVGNAYICPAKTIGL